MAQETLNTVIGRNIKYWRRRMKPKVTQQELGRRLADLGWNDNDKDSIDVAILSRIESGYRPVQVDQLVLFALALGVPLQLLLLPLTFPSDVLLAPRAKKPLKSMNCEQLFRWLQMEGPIAVQEKTRWDDARRALSSYSDVATVRHAANQARNKLRRARLERRPSAAIERQYRWWLDALVVEVKELHEAGLSTEGLYDSFKQDLKEYGFV